MKECAKTKEQILTRLHELAGMRFYKGNSTLPKLLSVDDVIKAVDLDNNYETGKAEI